MAKSDRSGCIQYGVLPYRIVPEQGVQILLLTSRGTQRWVIPKGWPIVGCKPREVAAIEAREEAGIEGTLSRKPIGSYVYAKVMDTDEVRLCECVVYLMRVTQEGSTWPEQSERRRAWFTQAQAADLVDEGSLALIIRDFLTTRGRHRHRR
jgi:8-oxo-dGTP pyrophosphatase MutT (NUDIX family)